MDAELADAAMKATFTPAVVQGILELSCTARKRVGKLFVYRNLTVRRRYKFTDFISDCPAAGSKPPEMHVSPIETYRNVKRMRHHVDVAPSLDEQGGK